MKGALTLLFHKMKSRLFGDPCSSINYCLLFIKGRGQAPLGRIIIHSSVPLCLAPPLRPCMRSVRRLQSRLKMSPQPFRKEDGLGWWWGRRAGPWPPFAPVIYEERQQCM